MFLLGVLLLLHSCSAAAELLNWFVPEDENLRVFSEYLLK